MPPRKKVEEVPVVESLSADNMTDIYAELMKGTQAHMVSDTSKGVLHDRVKIPTPVPQLNCIFGGGIPLGVIVEMFGDPSCLVGSTRIMTPDSKSITIEELYNRQKEDNSRKIRIYGISTDKPNELITDYAEEVRLTKHVDKIVEIEIDNKFKIKCTVDHPFLLTNGEYKLAERLVKNDELMSITLEGVRHYSSDMINEVTNISIIQLTEQIPVYGIINAGKYHNYAVALDEEHGVFVSNSGKSSTSYQMLGEFQKMYPPGKGLAIIVDTEASVDSQRMAFMGCDSRHILRIPAGTVEKGFETLYSILDKKVANPLTKDLPVFILWDTIGVSPTEREMDSTSEYAQGI